MDEVALPRSGFAAPPQGGAASGLAKPVPRRLLGLDLWCFAMLCLAMGFAGPVMAKEAVPVAADPALEARVLNIAAELRCLVCQNQTIADSHSGLAEDLRNQVREQLTRGASDEQVVQFMTDRYGDFVRYRPPFKASTALLWIGPATLLLIGLGGLALVLWRRSKLSPDQFEPDDDDNDAAPTAKPAPNIAGDRSQ